MEINSWEVVCYYCGFPFDFKDSDEVNGSHILHIPDRCPHCGGGLRVRDDIIEGGINE